MANFIQGDYDYLIIADTPATRRVIPEAIDKTKTRYADIPSTVVNNNITYNVFSLDDCFTDCVNLIKAPSLPEGVVSMEDCFRNCTHLVTPPVLPKTVEFLTDCFNGCTSLKKAPIIPSGIIGMSRCFYGCINLTGEILVYNNMSGSAYYSGLFTNTIKPITIVVKNPELLSTWSTVADLYDNVTIDYKLKNLRNYIRPQIRLPLCGDLSNVGAANVTIANLNSAQFVDDNTFGGSISFSSDGQGVNLSNYMATLKTYTTYSMMAWVYLSNVATNHSSTIISSGNWNTANGQCCFGLYSYNEGYQTLLYPNTTSWNTGMSIPSKVKLGEWYHIAITYDGSKTIGYINGIKIGESSLGGITQNSDSANVYIGCATYYTGFTPRGKFSDVRIYNTCLNNDEIYKIVKLANESDLILHYPLNKQSLGLGEGNPNLVMNTYSMPISSTTTRGFRVSGTGTVTHLDYSNLPVGDGVIRLTNNTSAAAWGGIAQDVLDGFVAGQRYSQSCWVRASTTITDFNLQPAWISATQKTVISTNKTINTTWQYIKYEGIILEGEQSTANPGGYSGGYAYCTLPAGGWMEICGMKVELGTQATPWTPHPLDRFNKIVNYDSNSVYTEPDGSKWIKIAHHNNPASALFYSSDNFVNGVYLDANRWYNIEKICNSVSSYEFIVGQTLTSGGTYTKYRWKQYKNPTQAVWADVQPGAVTRITTSGYTDGTCGGIFISNASARACIANASIGNWFGAFGSWTAYNGGIPGYPNTVVTSGYMDLWIRIDNAIDEFIEYDISGYHNDGERSGYFNWSTDTSKYEVSTTFNSAIPNYIRIRPENYIIQGVQATTWSVWAYNDDWSTYSGRIYSCTEAGGVNIENTSSNILNWAVSMYTNYQRSQFAYQGYCAYNPSNLSTGWHMFTWVFSLSGTKLYIDGILQDSIDINSYGLHFAWVPLFLGAEAGSTDQPANTYLTGKLSDFRIYKRALTAKEILSLYNNEAYIDDNNVIHGQIRD